MKDWMAIHTFLSEDAKAQHLSAKGKVRTEKEWAEYSMSLEKAENVSQVGQTAFKCNVFNAGPWLWLWHWLGWEQFLP